MKSYRSVLISAVCAVAFIGCSSGGGDSGSTGGGEVTGVQLDGAIAKGIVVDGPVTIEELDASGNAIATVGTARTGSDGSYQITLGNNYTGGVLQVTITADASTQMKCDIPAGCGNRTDGLPDPNLNTTIDFGEFYKPSALTMTALLPGAEANAVINASVTPFTHTAAERAKSQPTLDSAAVANANSEVSNLLGGVDILNIAPVDITDPAAVDGALSPTQVTYAALLSAIAMEADPDVDGQPLINDVLDLLASSFTSGTILADDLQVIVDNTIVVLANIGIVDVTGVLDELQQIIIADADGIIDPEPSPTINDPNLDKVKALMSDIRTWGNVIIAEAGDKASAFSMEVDMASDAVGILGTSAFDALAAAIDAAFLYDVNFSDDLADYNLDFPATPPNPRQFSSGQITSPTPGEITITDGVFKGYTVNMTVLLPPDGTVGTTFTLGITSVTIAGDDSDLSIPSGTLNVTFAADYTINYVTPNPLLDLADLLVDLPNASFIQYKDSLSGQVLVNPVTFSGTMKANLDPIPVTNSSVPGGEVLVLPKTMSLTGTISNGIGDSLDASLAANVTNTDTFEFFGDFAPIGTPYSVNHDGQLLFSWTYFDNDPSVPGEDAFTINTPDYSYWVNVRWDGNLAYISSSYNPWPTTAPANSMAEAVAYLGLGSFDVDVWVDNEGVYRATAAEIAAEDFTVNGSMDGKLVDPEFVIETASQWIKANIGLTFSLQLTGLPEARVNINADRTDFMAGNGSVTISYGSRQIEIAATVVENVVTTDYTGSVTITNQDGAKIVLDSLVLLSDQVFGTNDLSGVLLYNAIKYGTIEITSSGYLKVTYIDGTFEIF